MNDISSASSQQNNDFVVNGNKKENIPNALTNKEVINPTMKLETMDSSQVASVPECIKSVNMTQDSHPPVGSASTKISSKKQKKEKDGENDDDNKPGATLLDVYKALSNLSTPGSHCAGGVAANLPVLPGLIVEGVGLIPLPLTQETSDKLKSVARQAPHGRGMETVIDKSVRNTLEINADRLSFKNPHWSAALTKLVGYVATALGVNADLVRPELYKLLLYEKGGFFKKHRDTEKAEGMFATLVVQLPSCFTGGSFLVTHNKKSQKFRLDDPDKAPYQCHFVAHYADCEHEILPVESGYRLALIYSLCYTGSEATRPSLEEISKNSLVSVMNRLNVSDPLFAIPLEHQYTTLSLARLGVGALKGADRNLSKIILQGSSDGWELLIVKADRIDHEYCGGDFYSGFEPDDTEKGDPEIQEMFHINGKDASAHKVWLNRQFNFCSVAYDGMILASEDECEVMWEEVHSGRVEYTGNEGASRDTTYSTYLLVVFSKHGVFEKICRSNFNGAVNEVVKNPNSDHLDTIISFIQKHQPISSENFLKLYGVVCSLHADTKASYWDNLKVLVQHLSENEVPSSEVAAVLASLVKENGWNENTQVIRTLLQRLPSMGKTVTCLSLLDLVDVLLTITSGSKEDTGSESILRETLLNFEQATEESQAPCTTFIYYYKSNQQREAQPAEIHDRITALANNHSWNHMVKLVKPIFARMRKMQDNSIDYLAEEILVVRDFAHHQIAASEINDVRIAIMEDFVSIINAESKAKDNSKAQYSRRYKTSSTWKDKEIGVVIEEILSHGIPAIFEQIEIWASGASSADLSDADSIFQRINSSLIASEHVAAKDNCVNRVHACRWKVMATDYQKQVNALLQATRDGKPVFSWKMPDARTGCAALDEFLRSENQGPTEITVGGGINYARTLASGTKYGHIGGYSYSSRNIQVSEGFSAEISSTSKTGKNASVIVTKTEQWYNKKVETYEANMKKLAAAQVKLRQLTGNPSQPLAGQPPTKRSRNDVDVIAID